MIVTTLSIIWNYRVFAQIWLLRDIGANKDAYYTIGIWSYVESFSNKNFGYGAAIALISVVLLAGLSIFAVRSVLRSTAEDTGERIEKAIFRPTDDKAGGKRRWFPQLAPRARPPADRRAAPPVRPRSRSASRATCAVGWPRRCGTCSVWRSRR